MPSKGEPAGLTDLPARAVDDTAAESASGEQMSVGTGGGAGDESMESSTDQGGAHPGPEVRPPYRVLNGMVRFSGQCDECRPYCAAVCCRTYTFVSLTEEEVRSGVYESREPTAGCECESCRAMRSQGIEHTLAKASDGSCIYLDGARLCSIYADRPETCRNYGCANVFFAFAPRA